MNSFCTWTIEMRNIRRRISTVPTLLHEQRPRNHGGARDPAPEDPQHKGHGRRRNDTRRPARVPVLETHANHRKVRAARQNTRRPHLRRENAAHGERGKSACADRHLLDQIPRRPLGAVHAHETHHEVARPCRPRGQERVGVLAEDHDARQTRCFLIQSEYSTSSRLTT